MCFSFTAHLAWSGQKRSNAILIAMLAKGYAILIWWWAGILAFGEVDNNNFFEFPSWPKTSDLLFWFLYLYQFLRWVLSCAILWAGRLLWCGSCSSIERFCLDPAILDFTVALLWLLFGRLGLVVSLRTTIKWPWNHHHQLLSLKVFSWFWLSLAWSRKRRVQWFNGILSGWLNGWLSIWGVRVECGTTWVWYYTCSQLMRRIWKESPKFKLWKVQHENQDEWIGVIFHMTYMPSETVQM